MAKLRIRHFFVVIAAYENQWAFLSISQMWLPSRKCFDLLAH